ncbi:MAG: hypothetical protein U0941_29820 [Planctomycetaceae bacterium]
MTESDLNDDDDLDPDEFDAVRDSNPDPPEWWQLDDDDRLDLERHRCSQIAAVCLRCQRPMLALKWIADGTPLTEVMTELISMLAKTATPKTASEEFDESAHIFAAHDISRTEYVVARLIEKARARRCGW